MNRSLVLIVGLTLAGFADSVPLTAQRVDADRYSRFNVAVGLAMNSPVDVNQPPKCTELGLPCDTPRTFPDFGFVAQATVRATRHIAFVAEASVYGNGWDTVGVDRALTNDVSAIVVGPQLTTGTRTLQWSKDTTRYRAFVQILGGPEASTILPTRFALQPGVGFDGKLSWSPAWIRVAYDYRWTRGSPRNLSGERLLCALVFTFPNGS
jgi:hypothetical protein